MRQITQKYIIQKSITRKQWLFIYVALAACFLLFVGSARAQCPQWEPVGPRHIMSGTSNNNKLVFAPDGTPYVAVTDGENGYKMTVKKYNGTAWETVGTPGFTPTEVYDLSMAITSGGIPYVCYSYSDGYTYAMRFNGTTWESLGVAIASWEPSIVADASGNVYIAGDGATVVTYTGSTWEAVGGINSYYAMMPQITMYGSDIYVAFTDGDLKTTVIKYGGSSWSVVGSAGFTPESGTYPSIAIDAGGTPYVSATRDADQTIQVMKFNGSVWTAVGDIALNGTKSHIAFDASNHPHVTVEKEYTHIIEKYFDGTSWIIEGCNNLAYDPADLGTGIYYGGSFAIHNDIPYVAYTSAYGFGVVKLGACISYITGTQTVCTGSTTPLSNSRAGGTWTSSNTAVATVGSGTGVVSGVTAGTVMITYSFGASCIALATVTVGPFAGSISGSSAFSAGTYVTLHTSGQSGGTWTSGNPSVATVNAIGAVTGVAAGTAAITYTIAGCGGSNTTTIVTVNADPVPSCLRWLGVGAPGFSIGALTSLDMEINLAGDVYVAYTDAGDNNKAYVKRHNGATWETIGGGAISNAHCYIVGLSLDASGTPYVAYEEGDTAVFVRKFNGTGWTTIGTAGVNGYPDMNAYTSHFTVGDDGTPYLVLQNDSWVGMYVTKFNGVYWESITSNISATLPAGSIEIKINKGGTPYIAYTDNSTGTLLVIKYDGSSWLPVGGTIAGYISWPSLAFDASGNPYLGFQDYGNADKASVRHFNGSSWEDVGIPGFTDNAVSSPNLVVGSDGTPYLAYTDWVTSLSTVAKYNGSTWEMIAGYPPSVSYSVGAQVAINGAGKPYLFYADLGLSANAVVVELNRFDMPAITGTMTIELGNTTTLSNAIPGGTWSSSSDSFSAEVISNGTVYSYDAGTATISYTVGSCTATTIVTVTSGCAIDTITGPRTLCYGNTITLANATAGGTWSSSSEFSATVGSSNGIVTGEAGGLVNITYTTATCSTSVEISVDLAPSIWASITAPATLCTGGISTLANVYPGGNWSSSNTAIATVGSSTGIVTGVAAGTATISYTVTNDCGSDYVTAIATVNATPSTAGSITGTLTVCTTAATTLANATTGGTWTSSNTSVATIGSSSGIVSGVAAGNTTITYTVTNSCGTATTTAIATVNAAPSTAGTITGALTACVGATTTLSNATTGGTWTSSNTSIATIGSSSGIVSGVSAGNATITYTVTNSCGSTSATAVVTVSTGGSITGTTTLCAGTTSTLTAGSGTWTSSNTAVATVGSATGVVTGVAAGTSVISFIAAGGCSAATTVTISSAPPAITGTLKACPGTSSTLANALAGGAWSSSNTAVATIDASTGVATGIIAGTTTISYVLGGSCSRTAVFTVNATPAAIGGTLSACVGNTALVTNSTGGGVSWTSSNTTIATVGVTSGVVTAVSIGTTTITYTVNTGCYQTAIFTVNSGPAAITGAGTVCAGSTMTLGNTVSGGTWTSGSTSIATVASSTGIVTGVSGGVASITYNVGGCKVNASVTVSAIAAITGTGTMCIGSNTTLYNSTGGGTWTSSDAGVATVGSSNGAITGISGGTATITYTLGSGCSRTTVVTVTATAVTIGGTLSVCPAATTTLTNTASGGTWNGSNSAVASINSSTGVLTGVNAGTLNITYTIAGGCKAMTIATVNPLPANMGGTLNVCRDQSTTITNASTGGTWSSNNTAIAAIGAGTGIATGVAAGNTHITYTLPTGCYRAVSFTVKALPAAIGGSLNVCTTTSAVLSNATSGGVSWTSSSTGVATIGTYSGLLTGVSAGTSTITYTINTGCYITAVATVQTLPSAGSITGPSTVAVASTITLANAATGGVWSSSHPSRATVDVDGIVTGVSAGTATISYSVSNAGCTVRATKAISVTASRPGSPVVTSAIGSLQLYPNPTTGTFTIEAPEAGTFSIYTLDGKEVSKQTLAQGATVISLPNELANGIYMCRYYGESGITTVVRLVFEH
ncbi:MAG: Ig-like domain-containing protein [Bacteroidota bacterium]